MLTLNTSWRHPYLLSQRIRTHGSRTALFRRGYLPRAPLTAPCQRLSVTFEIFHTQTDIHAHAGAFVTGSGWRKESLSNLSSNPRCSALVILAVLQPRAHANTHPHPADARARAADSHINHCVDPQLAASSLSHTLEQTDTPIFSISAHATLPWLLS